MSTFGGDLIREARRRAGMSQTELAERVGTAQPGIARWESGRTAVSLDEVVRLVRACGFDLEIALVPTDDSDLAQVERLASLSPQERLDRHARTVAQLHQLRHARGA